MFAGLKPGSLVAKEISLEATISRLDSVLACRVFGDEPGSRPAAEEESQLSTKDCATKAEEEVGREVAPTGWLQVLCHIGDRFYRTVQLWSARYAAMKIN